MELLLALGCVFGNSNGCLTGAQAYGRYTGIEKNLQDYGEKHPEVSYSLAVAGAAKEQKLALPIAYGFYTTIQQEQYMLSFKREF